MAKQKKKKSRLRVSVLKSFGYLDRLQMTKAKKGTNIFVWRQQSKKC